MIHFDYGIEHATSLVSLAPATKPEPPSHPTSATSGKILPPQLRKLTPSPKYLWILKILPQIQRCIKYWGA